MKVLMVCLGNICRSPLAEGILKKKAEEKGIEMEVDSAGTAAYHIGERPDPRSREIASKYGIDISDQRARQFERADFRAFDRIYAMDRNNYEDILHLAASPEEAAKVDMILNAKHPGKNLSVPDPYYGRNDGFERVYSMLAESCEEIVSRIRENR